MMTDYCRNVLEPVYRIKEWYKPANSVSYFYYAVLLLIENYLYLDKDRMSSQKI
jgi:hypothetical protein